METMKAIICDRYGPPEVLQLKTVDKPHPKDREVLVRIHATTVHIGDTKIRGLCPGLGTVNDFIFKPIMRLILGFAGPRRRILGMELAGEIEAVGRKVNHWKMGDHIFAATGMKFGAYAEYTCLRENGIIGRKPANMTFEEAATIPNGGITALCILRKAKIQKGQKVLIYGASGSVGTFALQLAKLSEAEVTGVCSTDNLEMISNLGADAVIDYTASDFTLDSNTYDVVFDAVGKASYSQLKRALRKKGKYINILSASDSIKLSTEDLVYLKELIESGRLITVIDRKYSLEEMIEAHRYVDKGHKKGNVVIVVKQQHPSCLCPSKDK